MGKGDCVNGMHSKDIVVAVIENMMIKDMDRDV